MKAQCIWWFLSAVFVLYAPAARGMDVFIEAEQMTRYPHTGGQMSTPPCSSASGGMVVEVVGPNGDYLEYPDGILVGDGFCFAESLRIAGNEGETMAFVVQLINQDGATVVSDTLRKYCQAGDCGIHG
jgi:hypothetical protein